MNAESSPARVWSGAPSEIEFGAISLKICNLVATILVIFHWGNLNNFTYSLCYSHMRNCLWPKWPNGKYAYAPLGSTIRIQLVKIAIFNLYT